MSRRWRAPDRGFAALTEIVKRRYETGEFGNAHFKMPRPVLDEMRRQVPTPEPGTYQRGWLPGYSLGDLMGIPVVVDDELPPGTWRLVDTSTDEVVHEGVVDIPPGGDECAPSN